MTYRRRNDYLVADLAVPVMPVPQGSATSVYHRHIKRLLDILFVVIAALPIAAVLVPLALMVAMDGKSPFFLQDRIGRGGRIFRIVKLRTMVADADAALQAHLAANPAARLEWDLHQKLRDDPRITRVGHFLRKTSMDELPQFWNVLTGDMSVVGPRPMMVCQQDMYPGTEYYALRPGVTGFWQVSDRNESSFSDRAKFDRSYFDAVSLFTDLGVLFRTFGVVLRGTGC